MLFTQKFNRVMNVLLSGTNSVEPSCAGRQGFRVVKLWLDSLNEDLCFLETCQVKARLFFSFFRLIQIVSFFALFLTFSTLVVNFDRTDLARWPLKHVRHHLLCSLL